MEIYISYSYNPHYPNLNTFQEEILERSVEEFEKE